MVLRGESEYIGSNYQGNVLQRLGLEITYPV